MKMEIKNMDQKQIELRKAEISQELENPEITSEQLDLLKDEVDELEARSLEIKNRVETRAAKIKEVINTPNGIVIESRNGEKTMETKQFNLESPEYRSAFFKGLANEELSEIEKRAFTEVTTSFGGALPTQVEKEIISLIEEEYALIRDITTFQVPTVLEFTVHKSIKAGKAKNTTEGKGNDDEQNEFGKVSLFGKHFSKHVKLSYDISTMNGQGLDGYLQQEIAEQLGWVLNEDVKNQIEKDMETANKIVGKALGLTYEEVLKAFGSVKGKNKTVYVSNETLYNQLAGLKDDAGHLIFQPSFNDGISGYLLGAPVKVDESVDGVLIGNPKDVKGNYVMPVNIEQDRDIISGVNIYAGHTRFECALVKPKSFAKLSPKAGE